MDIKGYYIFFGHDTSINIRKKINMQERVLSFFTDIHEIIVEPVERSSFVKMIDRLPFITMDKWNIRDALNKIEDPDYIYVRRTFSDKNYIGFFREIKERYPKCKIIVEVYTYPYYWDDYANIRDFPFLFKELSTKKYFKDLIDRFVTFSFDETIFGVPAIHIINGIDINEYYPITPTERDDTIRMLALAMFSSHHGYERVIHGLHDYYKNGGDRNIELFMVGEGKAKREYEILVNKYELDSHVKFLGIKSGEELDEIFNRSDIALGSFGFYKKRLEISSVLKMREYLARGLPIVSGCTEDVFVNDNVDFYLHFPNDPSMVNIEKIVEFYDKLYGVNGDKRQSVIMNIRRFAEEHVSMEKTFQPVINYIKGNI